MNKPNIYDFAASLVQNNPNIANSPMGQNFIEALKNRDSQKGEEIANNILQNQGLDRDSAMNDIRQNIRSKIPNFPFLPF